MLSKDKYQQMKILEIQRSLTEASSARALLKDLPRNHPIFAVMHKITIPHPSTSLGLPANMVIKPSSRQDIEKDKMSSSPGEPAHGWLVLGPRGRLLIARFSGYQSQIFAIKPTTLVSLLENVNVLFNEIKVEKLRIDMPNWLEQAKKHADEIWDVIFEHTGDNPAIWRLTPEPNPGDRNRFQLYYPGPSQEELARLGYKWEKEDPAKNLLRRRQPSWRQDLELARRHRIRVVDELSDSKEHLPMIRLALQEIRYIDRDLETLEDLPWNEARSAQAKDLPNFLLGCMRAAVHSSPDLYAYTSSKAFNQWGPWTSQLTSGDYQQVDQQDPVQVKKHQQMLKQGAEVAASILKLYHQQLLVIHRSTRDH